MDKTDRNQALALVTGAAGRMGKVVALALAKAGYDILLHYHSSAVAARETASLIEQLGRRALLLRADLSRPARIAAMFDKAAGFEGQLHIVVNSAGIMPPGSAQDLPLEQWQHTIAVNTTAPFLIGQHAYRHMAGAGGLIVNIIDVGAEKAWSGFTDYSVSKAALLKLTELQARSFAPAVRVNGISPGLIMPGPDFEPSRWKQLLKKVPMGRQGSFEDIANAVLFLAQNDYVTGEILHIDGGYRLL